MGSSGKKRTTMAKLNRESRLRDKRAEKHARKTARKLTASRDAVEAASAVDAVGVGVDVPDGTEPSESAAVADPTGSLT